VIFHDVAPYTQIIEQSTVLRYVVGLSSLSKVMKFWFFFPVSEGGKELCFAVFFLPPSGQGNFGLHTVAHGSII